MDALDWMRWYGPAPREVRIIKPDGYVYGLRWTEGEQGARVLERAAAANADGCGIYYQSGEAGERWTGKAGTVVNGDIESARYAYCDFDPPRDAESGAALARWREEWRPPDAFEPTAIVDSGRGYQCFWRLARPAAGYEALERVEGVNKAIARRHGGDASVWNRGRVLRLPGFVNHKTGNPTRVLRADGPAWELDALAAEYPPPPPPESPPVPEYVDGVTGARRADETLARWIAALASAENRHGTLTRAATAVGGLVVKGRLSEDAARMALRAACVDNGMIGEGREAEFERTVRDQFAYAARPDVQAAEARKAVDRWVSDDADAAHRARVERLRDARRAEVAAPVAPPIPNDGEPLPAQTERDHGVAEPKTVSPPPRDPPAAPPRTDMPPAALERCEACGEAVYGYGVRMGTEYGVCKRHWREYGLVEVA